MKSSRRSIGQRASANTSAREIPSLTLLQEEAVAWPSRIAQVKWIEIQNEECTNHIINSIREEIVQTAIDTLYKDYLTKRSCSFVVHCAHTAWLQLFNWMHLKRDPGESALTVKEHWIGDEEHAPVPRDNWVVGNVEIRKKLEPVYPKICEVPCEQEDISRILPENISSPRPQESSGELIEPVVAKIVSTLNKERSSMQPLHSQDSEELSQIEHSNEEISEKEDEKETENRKSSDRSEVPSIFTRTISMPKDQLPIPRRSSVKSRPTLRGHEILQPKSLQSWKFDKVQRPRKLSVERLPPSRLDVKYTLIGDRRASSNSRVDAAKIPSRKSTDVKFKRESKNDSLKKLQ